MAINFPVTSWFFALLQLLVAAGAGVLFRWIAEKYIWPGRPVWIHRFVMLFFFGLVILFVKVS